MSRSYKKTPIVKDSGNGKKWAKNQANRRVRHKKLDEDGCSLIADGSAYQKEYCSWLIADYVTRWTEADTIAYYEKLTRSETYAGKYTTEEAALNIVNDFKEMYPTLEDFLKWWKKVYVRK